MHFGLKEEQQMIVDATRLFVEKALYPYESAVERSGKLPVDLVREIQQKAIAAGLKTCRLNFLFPGPPWAGERVS